MESGKIAPIGQKRHIAAQSGKPLLILASASPRRVDLLAQIGVKPDLIMPSQCDETPQKQEVPPRYVARIAAAKAHKIAAHLAAHPLEITDGKIRAHESRLILAADTTVAVGRRILGQAGDAAAAAKHLTLLSGRRHRVWSAVCVLHLSAGMEILAEHHKLVRSDVIFKRLHPAEIDHYVASQEWQGKAGSYAIQGFSAIFVRQISGSYSNIVGLPLYETASLLRHYGLVT
ncbi:MAG: Maf family protein [Alphaproteobacteria bacterium]|nr:Maf family protein [Alphaproteobacteria bacterium]